MARINEIQDAIIEELQSDEKLPELSTSVTSVWRLFTYIAAFFSLMLENLFVKHKEGVDQALLSLKPHSATWYQYKALLFQYGSDLADGLDTYDNSVLTNEQIDEQKIIAQCAVTELNGNLTIKVAKEVDEELVPLSSDEYNSFASYLGEIKDAGVNVVPLSLEADRLKMIIDVHYNPLILNSAGQRIDGTDDAPVEFAIRDFLRQAPFDGQYILSDHQDAVKSEESVVVVKVRLCQAARFDNLNFSNVDILYKPYAGFLRFYDNADLIINYIAWDV